MSFGCPVAFVGSGYNLHRKAAAHALRARLEALESVKDPKYAEIKAACIDKLKVAIQMYSKPIVESN